MEYLFAGKDHRTYTTFNIGRYIARSISISPILFAAFTGFIAMGTVRVFSRDNNLASDVPDISMDADNAISLLLSIIFSIEIVRLLSVSDARHKIALYSHKLTKEQRRFFSELSIGRDTDNGPVLPDPASATDFITAIYTMAAQNRLPSATHLRWALFDLTAKRAQTTG